MARHGRGFLFSNHKFVQSALQTLSVTVTLGDEQGGFIARLGVAHTPTIFTSEEATSATLTGVTAASAVGTINLSVTGFETLLTGVSAPGTAADGFTFTGLVSSGKWKRDKTKKNIPRGRWNRLLNFDNQNYAAGEDFVPVVDQYGQFRISTVSRDNIAISSLQSISDNDGTQGKP